MTLDTRKPTLIQKARLRRGGEHSVIVTIPKGVSAELGWHQDDFVMMEVCGSTLTMSRVMKEKTNGKPK